MNVDLPTFLVPHTRITAQPSMSPVNDRHGSSNLPGQDHMGSLFVQPLSDMEHIPLLPSDNVNGIFHQT